MAANFETIFQAQGLSHIASQILSYLDEPQDLLACSQVSKECHDLIFQSQHENLLLALNELRNKIEFLDYFPDWIQVFQYFENLENYPKTYQFIQFTKDFQENFRYEFIPSDLNGDRLHPMADSDDEIDSQEENPEILFKKLEESWVPCHHPIAAALVEDNLKILRFIMESPANFDPVYCWDYINPMNQACLNNKTSPKIIDLLLQNVVKKGIDLKLTNKDPGRSYTALHHAIINQNGYAALELVKFAIDKPRFKFIILPDTFIKACKYLSRVQPVVIEHLIVYSNLLGVNLNAKTNKRAYSGLHLILQLKDPNLDLIKFILDNADQYGIDVNKVDSKGYTPLLYASKRWNLKQDEILELFSQNELVDFKAKTPSGKSALDVLLLNIQCSKRSVQLLQNQLKIEHVCHYEKFDKLLNNPDFKDDYYARDIMGRSAFHNLCHFSPDRFYLQGNLLKTVKSFWTKISFFHAAQRITRIQFFLDAKDKNGLTPFELAIKTQNRDVMLFILEKELMWKSYTSFYTSLNMKDGFQAMMTLLICQPHNCCKLNSPFTINAIRRVLWKNKLDIPLTENLTSIVTCPEMKELIQDWLKTSETCNNRKGRKRTIDEIQ